MASKFCPYNLHISQTTQDLPEYDGESKVKITTTVLSERQAPMPCTRRKCGAWGLFGCKRRS